MVEEAVTQVCWAIGVSPRDGELRQTAWAEILSVYREDPTGFRGSGMRGWRLACDLAGEAVWKEEQYPPAAEIWELSLDQPVKGDTETTLLQLLHSPAGSCENSVCLWDYLSRQHPDVQRTRPGPAGGRDPGPGPGLLPVDPGPRLLGLLHPARGHGGVPEDTVTAGS